MALPAQGLAGHVAGPGATMRPTWSAAGERSASPPPNPKRTHNYMFPVLFTTQNNTTQTDVLGSRPWPRGLFTLSARLVDGAGRGWGPLHPIRCAGSTGGCSSAVPSSSGCEVKSLQ